MNLAPAGRLVLAGLAGGVAGFLTRPCCVVPLLLSLAGVGSATAMRFVANYREAFLVGAMLTIGASVWITFRREGGWVTKAIAASAAIAAFIVSGTWVGVL